MIEHGVDLKPPAGNTEASGTTCTAQGAKGRLVAERLNEDTDRGAARHELKIVFLYCLLYSS